MRFTAPPPSFRTRKRQQADACPAPITSKAAARHVASLHRAADVLASIPGPGETLHALMTGEFDLMHLIAVLIGQVGPCQAVRFATLSYNKRNLAEMLRLFDEGRVREMHLLCSVFFRDHNKDLWTETQSQFRDRRQLVAASRSHCKVTTFACTDGRRFTMEGSANLRTNKNREQFTLTHDAGVHQWAAGWIDAEIEKREAAK